MKALLDTYTFLWAISKSPRLSRQAQNIFVGPSDLWLSTASVWEILIKAQIGKISLPPPVGDYVVRQLAKNRIEALPVNLDHVLKVETLPMHHNDPFDRILIAQAIDESLPIVTADPFFSRYPVKVIW